MYNFIGWFFGGLAIILSFYFSIRFMQIGNGKITLINQRYSNKQYKIIGCVNLCFSIILGGFLVILFLW